MISCVSELPSGAKFLGFSIIQQIHNIIWIQKKIKYQKSKVKHEYGPSFRVSHLLDAKGISLNYIFVLKAKRFFNGGSNIYIRLYYRYYRQSG